MFGANLNIESPIISSSEIAHNIEYYTNYEIFIFSCEMSRSC